MTAVGLIVFVSFGAIRTLYDGVRASDTSRALTQFLLRLQVDEESSVRGYARTAQPAFLDPYVAAREQIGATIAQLRAFAGPSTEELAALARFTNLHDRWQRTYADPILSNARTDTATRERGGKALVDAMRGQIATLQRLQAERSLRGQQRAHRIETIAEIAVLLAIAVMALLGFVMERRAATREDRHLRTILTERDTATRLGEWRNKVIAMLAHDFRSTLTVIDTAATLHEDFPDEIDEAQTFARIHRAVAELSAMTDMALLMARVVAGAISVTKDEVPIMPLLRDIADRYRRCRRIDLQGPDLSVAGEGSYLLRIFDNIVSNAVKYSSPDTAVTINVRRCAEETAEIAVSDRGPGIDPADLPHIFEEYWRAPIRRQSEGQGLGLFIVKKLVDAHSGTIEVENYPGSGTTIYVRLPTTRGELESPFNETSVATSRSGRTSNIDAS